MADNQKKTIIFDEVGLTPGSKFQKGQWREIATHSETEIRGFFGDYRFLSNFWPARVFLGNEKYSCVETAYQAAKVPEDKRGFFLTCTPREAIAFVREHVYLGVEWHEGKLEVMNKLLKQKFNPNLNPDNFFCLRATRGKYLEETNYWQDVFWGVHKTSKEETGVGENNLGKLLMQIRDA